MVLSWSSTMVLAMVLSIVLLHGTVMVQYHGTVNCTAPWYCHGPVPWYWPWYCQLYSSMVLSWSDALRRPMFCQLWIRTLAGGHEPWLVGTSPGWWARALAGSHSYKISSYITNFLMVNIDVSFGRRTNHNGQQFKFKREISSQSVNE